MAEKKISAIQLMSLAPALIVVLDEVDDIFAPGGEREAEVLEAVAAAYDVLVRLRPKTERVPKEAVLQIVAGFHTLVCGLLDVQAALQESD